MRFQRDFSTNLRKEESHMADLKEFEQKAEELRVLGMKISVGQDTVYEHYLASGSKSGLT